MLIGARSPAMPCAPVAWRTSPFRHRTSISGPRRGSCPSEIRYGALVERHLIGRGRVKFHGHRCTLRSTGLVSSIFDILGLLCLYSIRRPFRIYEMPYDLTVNGQHQSVDADPSTPLLWVLRDHLGMTGTKYGCGIAQCGACTVHIDGTPTRSCQVPLESAAGATVTTIEGLSQDSSHPLQQLWVEMNVPQCGYCQSGMLMAAAALLKNIPNPTDRDIDTNVDNICRCGTYPRVRSAIHKAAARSKA